MNKLIRLAHDFHTRAAVLLGRGLRHATTEEARAAALKSWTLQTAGTRTLDNKLEHTLYDVCPAQIDMHWKEVVCHEFANACLTGDDGAVFLSSGLHLKDCPSLARHPDRKIRRPLRLLAQKIEEPCFHLAGRNYENHGHFLLHHLPRLLAAHNDLAAMGNPRILLGNREKRWQTRYLAAVGTPPEQVRRAGSGTTLVKRLFYTPQMWTDTALAAPEILLRIRTTFLACAGPLPDAQPPVLVSRADAPDRRLLNERDIAAEMERQWGACEVLELSKLDFATQVRKFAAAPLIVGALGQGFANLLVSSNALCLILDTEVKWGESYFSQTFRDLGLLHGNLASRLFADRPIQKREHWSYPIDKFKEELARATSLWKQHHP